MAEVFSSTESEDDDEDEDEDSSDSSLDSEKLNEEKFSKYVIIPREHNKKISL